MKPSLGIIARNWWPVAAWLGVIRLESTGYASAQNTFRLLYQTMSFLFGRVNYQLVFEMDHVLRKSGHFIGYAVLSGLTFLALRNTYRDRMQSSLHRPWGKVLGDLWRIEWSLLAILLTLVTASMDEIHQTFLPSRTGRWQDVVLDTSGAFALQLVIYLLCQLRISSSGGTSFPPAPKLPLAQND
ncbi:MAG: VanZ family protein [Candidatus Korobacteraceae bacterium]